MGIIIDVVLVAILVLNIIVGYRKGLVNVVFNICAFLLAIVITVIFYKPVSNMIMDNTQIDEKIRDMIINTNQGGPEIQENNERTDLQQYIDNMIENTAEEAKTEALDVVANIMASRGIEILTGILLFIAIRIVLVILKFILEGIAEIPIIKQFNEVGGLLYGVIKGVIIIFLLLTLLFFVVSINGNGIISEAIQDSHITKFLYENNIIVNYCLLGKNLL